MKSSQDILVALAGQPNSGKSSIFQLLTGSHQQVANYPGVTVEKKSGHYHENIPGCVEFPPTGSASRAGTTDFHDSDSSETNSTRRTHRHSQCNRRVEVVDLPGTYSLTSYTQEERITRDFLLLSSPEVVVVIVDASNLYRHLFLVMQILEMQLPTVVCLNMVDVARRRGLTIDTVKLSDALGVPVVPTNGVTGEGTEALRQAIHDSVQSTGHDFNDWKIDYDSEFEIAVQTVESALKTRSHLVEDFSARWLAVKLLENDFDARRIVQHHTHENNWEELIVLAEKTYKDYETGHSTTPQKVIAQTRQDFAKKIENDCVKQDPKKRFRKSDMIDRWACHPILGYLLLVLIMFFAFQLTFQLADGWNWFPIYTQVETETAEATKWGWQMGTPMGFVETVFDVWTPALLDPILKLDEDSSARSLIYDGIIAGVGGVIVFVPVIFFMFLILSSLEQTGYIARVALIMDRLMRFFGLQGQSIMPMILAGGISGGCAVPAIMTTRNMKDRRERILTILILPFMNCWAKIAVYAVLIGAFFSAWEGIVLASLVFISWGIALVCAKILSKTLVRGQSSPMLIEMPPYQVPPIKQVFKTATMQGWWFLKKAGTIILAVNVLLWCLMHYPRSNGEFDEAGQLANSYAGRIGRLFEPVSQFAGFDWRDNVALTGGFVAKEVIVSSLNTLYSMEDGIANANKNAATDDANDRPIDAPPEMVALGKDVAEENGEELDEEKIEQRKLEKKLTRASGWNAVKAFAMMLFVMVYAPCTASCIVIYQETHKWRWVVSAILFNTAVAFLLAVVVYQLGMAIFYTQGG